MAGTEIVFESNAPEIAAAFSRMEQAAVDMRAYCADMGEHLLLSHRFRWDLTIAPDGTPWEGLDPEYQARKRRHKDDILVLDRFLRDQLAMENDTLSQSQFCIVTLGAVPEVTEMVESALRDLAGGKTRGKDVKPLKGVEGYRLRRGGYRAISPVLNHEVFEVVWIGPRGDAYK